MSELFSFSGRVGRAAYWKLFIANIAFWGLLWGWLATLNSWERPQTYTNWSTGRSEVYWGSGSTKAILVMFVIGWCILAIIGLSIGIRRWHDLNKSGWWMLIGFVPFGGLYAFVMQGFVVGDPGPNRFGPGSDGARYTVVHQPVDQRDAAGLLIVGSIMSFIGSAIMLVFLWDIVAESRYQYSGDAKVLGFASLMLVVVAVGWIVGSHFGRDFAETFGFSLISFAADVVSGLFIAIAVIVGYWDLPLLLTLVMLFSGIALRTAVYGAYRIEQPELLARIGSAYKNVGSLFDTFPYVAILMVLLFQIPVGYRFGWEVLQWIYVAFFASSAFFVPFAFRSPSHPESPDDSDLITLWEPVP